MNILSMIDIRLDASILLDKRNIMYSFNLDLNPSLDQRKTHNWSYSTIPLNYPQTSKVWTTSSNDLVLVARDCPSQYNNCSNNGKKRYDDLNDKKSKTQYPKFLLGCWHSTSLSSIIVVGTRHQYIAIKI